MPVENKELVEAVTQVLRTAQQGREAATTGFLTAQQILQDLAEDLQERLEEEYAAAPARSRHPIVRVAQAAFSIEGLQVEWMDARWLGLKVQDDARMGPGLIGLYRLPPGHPRR